MVWCMLVLVITNTTKDFVFSLIFDTDIWKQSLKFKLTKKNEKSIRQNKEVYSLTEINFFLAFIDIWNCVSIL
jgi:hypothetical protein